MDRLRASSTSSATSLKPTDLAISDVKKKVFEISLWHQITLSDDSIWWRQLKYFLDYELLSLTDADFRLKWAFVFDLVKIQNEELIYIYEYLVRYPAQSVIFVNTVSDREESIKNLIVWKELILKIFEFPNVRQLKTNLRADSYPLGHIIKNLFDHRKNSYWDYLKAQWRDLRYINTRGYFIDYLHLAKYSEDFCDLEIFPKIDAFAESNNLSVVLVASSEWYQQIQEAHSKLSWIWIKWYWLCKMIDCNWITMPFYSWSYSAIQKVLDEKLVGITKFKKLREL